MVKIFKKSDEAFFKNEYNILQKVQHDNIEKYYENFEIDSKHLAIVTEYCPVMFLFLFDSLDGRF